MFNVKYAKAVFGEEWRKGLEALNSLEMISCAGSDINKFISNLFYYPRSYPGGGSRETSRTSRDSLDKNIKKIKEHYDIAKKPWKLFFLLKR